MVTSDHVWSHLCTSGLTCHNWSYLLTPVKSGPTNHLWSQLVTPETSGHTWSSLVASGHRYHMVIFHKITSAVQQRPLDPKSNTYTNDAKSNRQTGQIFPGFIYAPPLPSFFQLCQKHTRMTLNQIFPRFYAPPLPSFL